MVPKGLSGGIQNSISEDSILLVPPHDDRVERLAHLDLRLHALLLLHGSGVGSDDASLLADCSAELVGELVGALGADGFRPSWS